MKKRIIIAFMMLAMIMVAGFSQEKTKTYKLKSSDIEIKGMLKPYIKVADGVYDVTLNYSSSYEENNNYTVYTMIKFEIKKTCPINELIEKIKTYFPNREWKGFDRLSISSLCLYVNPPDYRVACWFREESYPAFASFLECEPGDTETFYFSETMGHYICTSLPTGNDATALGHWSLDTTIIPSGW